MKSFLKYAALWLLVLVAACCLPLRGEVADTRLIPQDPTAFTAKGNRGGLLVGPAYQATRDKDFDRRWLACWSAASPRHGADEVAMLAEPLLSAPGLGPNLKTRDTAWARKLLAASNLHTYPSQGWRGISLAPANLRVLPSQEPQYKAGPGGGPPFDLMQQTSLPAGTPLRVWHAALGGRWLLVETPSAMGWLPRDMAGRADDALCRRWSQGPFLAVVKDRVDVRAADGTLLFQASIGSLFPLLGRDGEQWRILAPITGAHGQARAAVARLELAAGTAKPLALKGANLARLAAAMMHTPYDWGGAQGGRDCSALLRDLFTPFGLWLPRNSHDQWQQGGQAISLEGMSNQLKLKTIHDKAIPWLSILYLPGHVMLYLGSPQGRPLVLHSLWGLRTMEDGVQGRHVMGRPVITSLAPGQELPNLARPEGILLNRLSSLILLVPPGQALGWHR